MRNPNGFGSIKKLGGKRRRPFAVYVTTGWTYQDGKAKQIQKPVGYYATRPEAMIALAEYNKNPFDLDKRNTTFGQIYEILYRDKFSSMKDSARYSYVTAFNRCKEIENIRMFEMKKAHMQKIVDDNVTMSKSSLNNLLKLFHAVYRFALENDICEKNYAEFVTATSEQEAGTKTPFSREEIETLWKNQNWIWKPGNPSTTPGMCFMDMPLIHIYTGMRPTELFTLQKTDIHLEERWIDLRGTKTKAAKRIVPIHKKIIPLIEARMKAPGEYLFPTSTGVPFTNTTYATMFFKPMCKHFKLQTHTPHECRHTFATFAHASAMNKVLLKKIIGHSAGDLTEDTYTHAFIDDLITEIDKLNL